MRSVRLMACLLAAATGIVLAQPRRGGGAPQPPMAGSGSIQGQVVSAATGAPLKKTNVSLFGFGDRQNRAPTRSMAETDEQGHFAFANLPPGRYQLNAERQGYLQQSYGARRPGSGGTPVQLAEDQQMNGLVFKLSPAAVIVGRVLDQDGDPVANVGVQALKYMYRSGKRQWVTIAGGSANDIGEFRIPNLAPGRYLVSANARNLGANYMRFGMNGPLPDKPEMVYGTTYFPGALDTNMAAPVDVGSGGEVRGIDIRLVKTKVFHVRGKIAGLPAGGRPVMVTLIPTDGTAPQSRHNGMVRPPESTFEIPGVAAGSYTAFAQTGNNQQEWVAAQRVEVNNHVDGLVLTLAPGTDIPGSIKVVDSTAPVPLTNVNINLRAATPAMGGGAARARVGEDLRFTLKSVPPLRYSIIVSGVPENCYVQSVRYGGQEVPANDSVEMTGPGPVEVTLSAAAGAVDATVVNKDGQPANGATVVLVSKDGSMVRAMSSSDSTAPSFHGLPPGEYLLFAWEDAEPGAYQDPDFRKPFEGRAERVKVEAGDRKTVQVRMIGADEMDAR